MRAMLLKRTYDLRNNKTPLEQVDVPALHPAEREILVKVSVCGVCHTELDEIEGRTPPATFPIILGHQVVGTVHERERRSAVTKSATGWASRGFIPLAATVNSAVGVGRIYAKNLKPQAGTPMAAMPNTRRCPKTLPTRSPMRFPIPKPRLSYAQAPWATGL